uniref:Uncharacterized protein n=1 Tax=Lactuca sativa TaxID=4236 RepID=A0A9R1WXW3_LACSA|nr:hypothetical protein LSAT_V11C800423680 [Lactuca sativa]
MDEYLSPVYDLHEFNRQLSAVFDKIDEHLNAIHPKVNSRPSYTVHGFVYAFKIWIMKKFLRSQRPIRLKVQGLNISRKGNPSAVSSRRIRDVILITESRSLCIVEREEL